MTAAYEGLLLAWLILNVIIIAAYLSIEPAHRSRRIEECIDEVGNLDDA